MQQEEPRRTLSGTLLDSLWLGTMVCLLTLFTYLVWALIEVQNHYYFITTPFTTSNIRVP
jgi:hypothetical protein